MSEFGSEPRSGNKRRKHFDFSRVVKVEAGSKSRARLFLFFFFFFFFFSHCMHLFTTPVFDGSFQFSVDRSNSFVPW